MSPCSRGWLWTSARRLEDQPLECRFGTQRHGSSGNSGLGDGRFPAKTYQGFLGLCATDRRIELRGAPTWALLLATVPTWASTG